MPDRIRIGRPLLWVSAFVLAAMATLVMGYPALAGDAVQDFGGRRGASTAIAFFSGDMGFSFGMSGKVAKGLAGDGVPVIGFSSPRYFAHRRTLDEANHIVADAVRLTIRRTGAKRIILMGQSYGADIVATTAPNLPIDVRDRLAGVVMIVPAQTVYFRSDPLGLAYHGEPDARPLDGIAHFHAAPLVCIYGVEEEDSLCPPLSGKSVHIVALPGGHFLHHDQDRLLSTLTAQLGAIDPKILPAQQDEVTGGRR